MKNIIKSIKKILPIKKETTAKELFDRMDSLLDEAEKDFGGNFFPKEELLTTEQVHYKALDLNEGSDFEQIKESYIKLKKIYNPQKYKNNEIEYQNAIEANTRIELAFNYFKNKFESDK